MCGQHCEIFHVFVIRAGDRKRDAVRRGVQAPHRQWACRSMEMSTTACRKIHQREGRMTLTGRNLEKFFLVGWRTTDRVPARALGAGCPPGDGLRVTLHLGSGAGIRRRTQCLLHLGECMLDHEAPCPLSRLAEPRRHSFRLALQRGQHAPGCLFAVLAASICLHDAHFAGTLLHLRHLLEVTPCRLEIAASGRSAALPRLRQPAAARILTGCLCVRSTILSFCAVCRPEQKSNRPRVSSLPCGVIIND